MNSQKLTNEQKPLRYRLSAARELAELIVTCDEEAKHLLALGHDDAVIAGYVSGKLWTALTGLAARAPSLRHDICGGGDTPFAADVQRVS